jgi:hypothetical protein
MTAVKSGTANVTLLALLSLLLYLQCAGHPPCRHSLTAPGQMVAPTHAAPPAHAHGEYFSGLQCIVPKGLLLLRAFGGHSAVLRLN